MATLRIHPIRAIVVSLASLKSMFFRVREMMMTLKVITRSEMKCLCIMRFFCHRKSARNCNGLFLCQTDVSKTYFFYNDLKNFFYAPSRCRKAELYEQRDLR